jgi:hypothetical protein
VAAGVAAPAQVEVVRLQVRGRLGRDRRLLLRREGHPQGLGDVARDLVLHREDVGHLAVVALGPEERVGRGVEELGGDAEATAAAPDAARQDAGGLQLLADVDRRNRLVPEGQHGLARQDLEALDLRELRDDVLGHAVAEVLVLLHAGEVLEVEDRDRPLGRPRGAATGVLELRRAPVARVGVALQAQEVRLELGRGLAAQVAVLLEGLREDPPELGRQRRHELGDGRRLPVEDRVEDDGRGLALEGQDAGGHLVEHGPEREEVRARVRQLAARLLRRHVGDGAHRGADARELVRLHRGGRLGVLRAGLRARSLDLGEPEVQDLRLPSGGHEDVGGLEVAVHDPLRVRRLEGVRDLDPDVEERPDLERPLPDPLGERLPLEELHRDEVLPLVLLDRVDRADAGVVELRGRLGLALEALERRRVLRQLDRQELERHAAAELRVLGLVDDTHAAAAELPGDLVVRGGLADH